MTPPATSVAATPAPSSAGIQGKLEGIFSAQPNADTAISLGFLADGRFEWKVTRQGKEQRFAGKFTYENGILTLVQDQNGNAMVGNVTWTDESHFGFKVVGGVSTDPGLSFTKA
jgi:hypothetical protein